MVDVPLSRERVFSQIQVSIRSARSNSPRSIGLSWAKLEVRRTTAGLRRVGDVGYLEDIAIHLTGVNTSSWTRLPFNGIKFTPPSLEGGCTSVDSLRDIRKMMH